MELFKLFGSIFVKSDDAEKSISKVDKKAFDLAGTLGNGITVAAKFGAALVAGTAAAIAGTYKMAESAASAGDEIDKMSQKIGVSREAYQELDFICSQCGTDVSKLQGGMKTLTNTMQSAADGSSSASATFEKLGLSIYDANGSLKDQETMMWESLEALQGVSNETEKAALANDLFGKSGTELMPLLNGASGSIEEMKNKAQELGLVMSDEFIDNSVKFTDTLDQVKRSFGACKNEIAGVFIPVFQGIGEKMVAQVPVIREKVNEIVSAFESDGIEGAIQAFGNIFGEGVTFVGEKLPQIIEMGSNIITSLVNGIAAQAPQLASTAANLITTFVTQTGTMGSTVLQAGVTIATSLVSGLAQSTPEILTSITTILTELIQTIVDNAPSMIDAALELAQGLVTGLLESIPIIVEALPELVISITDTLLGAAPDIATAGIQLLTSLVTELPKIIQSIVEVLPEIVNGIVTTFSEHVPDIIQAGNDLLMALITDLPQIILTIAGALPQIIDGIVGTLTDDENLDKIIEAGVTLLVSLIENLPQIIVTIASSMPQIVTGIVNALVNSVDKIYDAGEKLFNKFFEGLKSVWTSIYAWVEDKVGWIADVLNVDQYDPVHNGSTHHATNTHTTSSNSVSHTSAKKHAKGGVVEKGEIAFLEGDGAEAVVPLEKNKQWIARVAEDMEAATGGNASNKTLEQILGLLTVMSANFPELLEKLFASGLKLDMNNRDFARLVRQVI